MISIHNKIPIVLTDPFDGTARKYDSPNLHFFGLFAVTYDISLNVAVLLSDLGKDVFKSDLYNAATLALSAVHNCID
jgi:hypothetical protein